LVPLLNPILSGWTMSLKVKFPRTCEFVTRHTYGNLNFLWELKEQMEAQYKDRFKFVKEEKDRQNSGETPIVALSGFSSGWWGEGRMQTGWDWNKKGNIDGR
jgi:hypothetical protein